MASIEGARARLRVHSFLIHYTIFEFDLLDNMPSSPLNFSSTNAINLGINFPHPPRWLETRQKGNFTLNPFETCTGCSEVLPFQWVKTWIDPEIIPTLHGRSFGVISRHI